MAALTQRQKRWIVERLAIFDSPSEVVRAFREEYGVRLDRQQVNNYDGSKEYSRKRMAKKLVALFDDTRERFKRETDDIAIAHKSYRLRRLDENERKAREAGNILASNATLKQAAEEQGDAYTNTHKLRHTGKDDDTPIQSEARVLVTLPDNGRGDRAPGALTPRGEPTGKRPGDG